MHQSAETYAEYSYAITAATISLRSHYDEEVKTRAFQWLVQMEHKFAYNKPLLKKIARLRARLEEVTQ